MRERGQPPVIGGVSAYGGPKRTPECHVLILERSYNGKLKGRPHCDLSFCASITAKASVPPPCVPGILFPAWSVSSFITLRICSSDWTTPAASKSLRILLSTSLRSGSSVPTASASE